MYGAGRKPSTELMLTMRPLPWRRMWGKTARVIRRIPKKFVSKIDRACSIELSSAPAGAMLNPALLTRRSRRPSDRSTAAQAVIAAHLTATPKPLTDVRPEAPPEVASAIARALAKDP